MASADTGAPRSEELAYLIAGLVNLTAGRVTGVMQRVQGVLRRSDLGLLADDGRADLRSRGELTLRRGAYQAEAHLEALARRVAAEHDDG